VMGEEDDKVE